MTRTLGIGDFFIRRDILWKVLDINGVPANHLWVVHAEQLTDKYGVPKAKTIISDIVFWSRYELEGCPPIDATYFTEKFAAVQRRAKKVNDCLATYCSMKKILQGEGIIS